MLDRLEGRTDLLSETLASLRMGGTLTSRAVVRGRFGLRFESMPRRAGFHVVLRGRASVVVEPSGMVVELAAGDVVLFPHGDAHRLADDPHTKAVDAKTSPGLPPRRHGREVEFMCGVYDLGTAEVPVLHGLPEVLVVRSHALEDDALASLIGLLHAEAQHERSGAALVMRHLVDLLFVHTVRAWTAAHGEASWLGAAADPEIGTALAAIHRAPATRWTVASLARRAGMSRAVFSRRFREATGDPPMTYVTRCRMAHAADRLQAGLRVNEVAAEVGYDNEFAFARAFKRTRGIPPGAVRTRRR